MKSIASAKTSMKKGSGVALVLGMILVSVGCAHRTADRAVSMQQIGEPGQTRIVNYKSAPMRPGSPTEKTPSGVARDAVADEAELLSYQNGEVCIALTTRTHIDLDEPLSVYRLEVGEERVYPGEEFITVVDYSYTGERTIFSAEGMTRDSFASMRLTEPEERIYRVIERETEVCSMVPSAAQIELKVVLPMDDARGHWGERFVWNLR